MAGDTRESPREGGSSNPDNAKTYEVFHSEPASPPPSANALPEGSGLNTAGAHAPAPTLGEALKTVRLEDFKQVHMYPCVRDALLAGIGGGFGVGGVRALLGGSWSPDSQSLPSMQCHSNPLYTPHKQTVEIQKANIVH